MPVAKLRFLARMLLVVLALLAATRGLRAQRPLESLWYLVDNEESIQSFLAHADHISVVAPQTYTMDEHGIVWGGVDARVLDTARAKGIRVMPLVLQPGFDQPMFQKLLRDPEARRRGVENLARLCRENGFWGIQFDFENIHVTDRERFTEFYREAADALHGVGCTISVAVVPRTGEFPGETSYHKWIFEYWRGAYDYRALAEAGDFLSLMTYDQHTHRTPPGPIAGLPWVERALEYVLSVGVPPAKISLGIPAYSGFWQPSYDPQYGARTWGRGLGYVQARGLLEEHDVKPLWDEGQKVFYAFWENDGLNEFVFLEDAESFRHKLEVARRRGLRGFSVWRLGHEDPSVWELLARERERRGPR